MIKRKDIQLYMGMTATGMLLVLNGCGAATDSPNTAQTETVSTIETMANETEQQVQLGEKREGCIIQEDEQYLYFCGGCRVSKIDKETGEEVILWENADEVASQKEYLFSRGSGMLIDDTIYFIEGWYDAEDNFQRALSSVKNDGTDYERIIEMKYTSDDIMFWQDGVLYVDDMDREIEIKFAQDGTIVEKNVQDRGYQEKLYYDDNGARMLFEQQSRAEFGTYLEQTDDGYVMSIHPETGEKEYLDELVFFKGYNSKYFLTTTYEDGMTLHLIDRETGEDRELLVEEENFCVLALDEEYVYIKRNFYEDEGTRYCYERIALVDGSVEELFERKQGELWELSSENFMDTVISNGYIYYTEEQDLCLYRCRRSIDSPENIEIIGDVMYDSGIADIGTIQTKKEAMYSETDPEKVLYNMNLSWLAVDDKYPGSNLINTYLNAHQEANMSYAREQYEYMIEGMDDWDISEFSSSFSGFTYVDSHYISFVQTEYEYQAGAAHGMPWWIGFTFDLESGERMLLSDILYNSEEELKELVTQYFEELVASQEEGYYWEDATSYVQESVNMESEFYLTDEGIVFFYGPYELACYAAGFQEVTVPYEEFDLRIILNNK